MKKFIFRKNFGPTSPNGKRRIEIEIWAPSIESARTRLAEFLSYLMSCEFNDVEKIHMEEK